MSNYSQWDKFDHIYLEDSFVLGISESENQIIFDVEFVLTEAHPLYVPPKNSEQYCYHKGRLVFNSIITASWKRKLDNPFVDANGDQDYGNIDVLRTLNDGYEIFGDWGELKVQSSHVQIILK